MTWLGVACPQLPLELEHYWQIYCIAILVKTTVSLIFDSLEDTTVVQVRFIVQHFRSTCRLALLWPGVFTVG
jgi:hypothetical protein